MNVNFFLQDTHPHKKKISNNTTTNKKISGGTHTTFSHPALQLKNILLSALHSYLIFNFYDL